MASRRKPRTLAQIIRIRCNSANYRAEKLGLDERLVPGLVSTVPEYCPFCSKKLGVRELSLDHIIPFSKGGRNTWANVQWTCRKCNRYRGNFDIEEYREFLKLLADAGWTERFFRHFRPRSFRAKD